MAKERNTNEIKIKINGVEVVLVKTSNIYKVNGIVKYLKQIVWDRATDSIIQEIEEDLKK